MNKRINWTKITHIVLLTSALMVMIWFGLLDGLTIRIGTWIDGVWQDGQETSIASFYVLVCALTLLTIVCVEVFYELRVHHRSNRVFRVGVMIALLWLGFFNMIVTKPLCVPDEESHFATTYQLSNCLLRGMGQKNINENSITEPGFLLAFSDIDLETAVNFYLGNDRADSKPNLTECGTIEQQNWTINDGIPAYTYLPGAIGISAGRLLRLPYQWIMVLGRMTNLLFLAFMGLLAICIAPDTRYIVAGLSLLPGNVWLMASFSYDVWNMAWVFVFFALCMRIRTQECGVRFVDLAALAVSVVMFAPIKIIYIVLGLAIFLIPRSQWKNKKLIWVSGGAILLAVVAMAIARGSEIIGLLTSDLMDPRGISDAGAESYTLSYILHNPFAVILTVLKTFVVNTESFIIKGIAGEFYSSYVPRLWIALCGGIIVLLMLTSAEPVKCPRKARRMAGVIVFLGCASVYFAFIFVFSQIPSRGVGLIGGMQARYFMPFFVLLPIAVYSKNAVHRLEGLFRTSKIPLQEKLLHGLIVMNVVILYSKWIGIALEGIR